MPLPINILSKPKLLGVITVSVFLILLVVLVLILKFDDNTYFAKFEHVGNLKPGDPVLIEGIEFGKVSDLELESSDQTFVIAELKVDREINIPDMSKVSIVTTDKIEGRSAILIDLFSSTGYMNNGDTFPANYQTPEDTSIAVDVVKESAGRHDKSNKPVPFDEDSGSQKNRSPDIIFSIQLMSVAEKPGSLPEIFNSIADMEISHEGDTYKYFTGAFSDIEKARKHKNKLCNNGFDDAFIVAFENGRKIPVALAIKKISKHKNTTPSK